jgi:hypothetical protein
LETDILVVGNGLAAWGVLNRFAEIKSDLKITQVSQEKVLPSCALKSTATVSLNGIQKNISPLGDLLYDSFFTTTSLIEKWGTGTIEKAEHLHLGNSDKIKQRFHTLENIEKSYLKSSHLGARGDVYLFNPSEFYDWFNHHIKKQIQNLSEYNDLVTDFKVDGNNVFVETLSGRRFLSKKLILTTGAWGRGKTGGKLVCGHYLSWHNCDFEESFLISLNQHNLIYNKSTKLLMLGGTSNSDEVSLADVEKLKSMYQCFVEIFRSELPAVENAKLSYGVRQKGKKRMPYWGKLQESDNIYTIHSLYKNGYTLGWELGKRIVDQIKL